MKEYLFLIVRKLRSSITLLVGIFFNIKNYSAAFANPSLMLAPGCTFGSGVTLKATDGGVIALGSRVSLSDHVQIVCRGGKVIIGDDVFIGRGSIITSMQSISIGTGCQIAEYVVIRDQDHLMNSHPIRDSGFATAPIHIGADVWIGAKASILRGVNLGDRCVIGAHGLVNADIPPCTLAVGVPARGIKRLSNEV